MVFPFTTLRNKLSSVLLAEEGWFGGLLHHVASLFEGLHLPHLAAAVTSRAKLGLLLLHSPASQSLLLVPRHSARGWA